MDSTDENSDISNVESVISIVAPILKINSLSDKHVSNILDKPTEPSSGTPLDTTIEISNNTQTNIKNIENKIPRNTKVSVGIACCRYVYTENGHIPQILMVSCRNTYCYIDFVYGRYTNKKIGKKNNDINTCLMDLFNGMTTDEKIEILSLKFDRMWNRIWCIIPSNSLANSYANTYANSYANQKYQTGASDTSMEYDYSKEKTKQYFSCKNKFENTFLIPDGGAKLKKLINNSTNSSKIWEIPKGRIKYDFEPFLNCAIREFSEETNINKSMYKLLPNAKKILNFSDGGINYQYIYYIAFTKYHIDPKINMKNDDQFTEIDEIKWMTINDVRLVDKFGYFSPLVKSIFNYLKKNMENL